MKKLSGKGLRVLRKFYSGLGAAVLSFLFPGCGVFFGAVYGPPPPGPPPSNHSEDIRYGEETRILGQVKSKKTGAPIPGITIWIKGVDEHETNIDGRFLFFVPKQDNYTIIFFDFDKNENGGLFASHELNLTMEECEALTESPLIVELEEVDAE